MSELNEQEQKRKNDGQRYHLMRESMNLSRDGLAGILGTTRQAIYLRENGMSRITEEHWLAIQAIEIRRSIISSDKIRALPSWKVKKLNTAQVS